LIVGWAHGRVVPPGGSSLEGELSPLLRGDYAPLAARLPASVRLLYTNVPLPVPLRPWTSPDRRSQPAPLDQPTAAQMDQSETAPDTLDALNHVWRSSLLLHLSPSARRSVARRVAQLSGPVSDTVRESSLIASERSLTAASIRDVCAIGLSRMFR
jgi:hypothetical protein